MKSRALTTPFRRWRWKVNIYHLLLMEQEMEILTMIHGDIDLTDGETENSDKAIWGEEKYGKCY